MKVIIVGGGPAGLTAAHALHHARIDFVLLEKRKGPFVDQGASLVLSPGTLRIMHQFGLLNRLLAIGAEIQHNKAFTKAGFAFRDTWAFAQIRKNHGISPVAFHRAHLVQVLYDTLPDGAKLRYLEGKKLAGIESTDTGVKVICADGSSYSGSLVIGADGVHSSTRRAMRGMALEADSTLTPRWDPEPPFKAEYKCLFCSFPRPTAEDSGQNYETHDKGRSVMFITGRERAWIFLYERLREPSSGGFVAYSDQETDAFAATFAEYAVCDGLTVKDAYERRITAGMTNLEEGCLKYWHWGRVALVGDACHKFTPNAGLGFNSGVQDVVALVNGLYKAAQEEELMGEDTTLTALHEIFSSYQKSRAVLLQRDSDRSAKLTRMHSWNSTSDYLMARYVMSWEIVQGIYTSFIAAGAIRQSLVLNYIPAEEPFRGSVPWDHPLPVTSGK